jgi:TonB family protein
MFRVQVLPRRSNRIARHYNLWFLLPMSHKLRLRFCFALVIVAGSNHALPQTAETPSNPAHRLKVSEVTTAPLITEKTPPSYPDAAREAGIQGTVMLKVVVAETGEVKEVSTLSGDPLLAQPAVDAVKQWKYKPYMVDGTPVEMETQVTLTFRLHTGEHSAPPLGNSNPAHRLKVSEGTTAPLITEKTPPKYPDATRDAGIQGTVVLKVVVAETGEVKEVSALSGDPLLAQAAVDAVKQWKYKPYTLDGTPVEMETQATLTFRLQTGERTAPPLGIFRDGTYENEFFEIYYPLSRDWVRETRVMRKRISAGASGPSPAMYVLLAAVHIPWGTAPEEADSSFVFSAIESAGRNCEQNLQAVAQELHSQNVAQEEGTITPLTFAGRDFYRGDFDFRESPTHRTFLCTQSKDYLLEWNIDGLSEAAVESTLSTLNAIGNGPYHAASAATQPSRGTPDTEGSTESQPRVARVRVAQGLTQGMLISRVNPVYPRKARHAHIQGSVFISAVINKNGDVVDLEVVDGPIELAVSAVNAVRQWKYRPYVLMGEPVEVDTQITINYSLSPR